MNDKKVTTKKMVSQGASTLQRESVEFRKSVRDSLSNLQVERNQLAKQRSQERIKGNNMLKTKVSSMLGNYRRERSAKWNKLSPTSHFPLDQVSNKPICTNSAEEKKLKIMAKEPLVSSNTATPVVPPEKKTVQESVPLKPVPSTSLIPPQNCPQKVAESSKQVIVQVQEKKAIKTDESAVIPIKACLADEQKKPASKDVVSEVTLAKKLPSADNLPAETLSASLVSSESQDVLSLDEISEKIVTADAERLARRLVKKQEIKKEGEKAPTEKSSGETVQ